jgi:hypothetical protein
MIQIGNKYYYSDPESGDYVEVTERNYRQWLHWHNRMLEIQRRFLAAKEVKPTFTITSTMADGEEGDVKNLWNPQPWDKK